MFKYAFGLSPVASVISGEMIWLNGVPVLRLPVMAVPAVFTSCGSQAVGNGACQHAYNAAKYRAARGVGNRCLVIIPAPSF